MSIHPADRTELQIARRAFAAAEAAWKARGSDRNIEALYRAEMRLLAVRDAIRASLRREG